MYLLGMAALLREARANEARRVVRQQDPEPQRERAQQEAKIQRLQTDLAAVQRAIDLSAKATRALRLGNIDTVVDDEQQSLNDAQDEDEAREADREQKAAELRAREQDFIYALMRERQALALFLQIEQALEAAAEPDKALLQQQLAEALQAWEFFKVQAGQAEIAAKDAGLSLEAAQSLRSQAALQLERARAGFAAALAIRTAAEQGKDPAVIVGELVARQLQVQRDLQRAQSRLALAAVTTRIFDPAMLRLALDERLARVREAYEAAKAALLARIDDLVPLTAARDAAQQALDAAIASGGSGAEERVVLNAASTALAVALELSEDTLQLERLAQAELFKAQAERNAAWGLT